jgi:hypothetical protein
MAGEVRRGRDRVVAELKKVGSGPIGNLMVLKKLGKDMNFLKF